MRLLTSWETWLGSVLNYPKVNKNGYWIITPNIHIVVFVVNVTATPLMIIEERTVFSMNKNIYRMIKYLQDINTNPDKEISYYSGTGSDYHPAVMVHDLATDEIIIWCEPLTHTKFRAMLSEVKTDYLHLSDIFSHLHMTSRGLERW